MMPMTIEMEGPRLSPWPVVAEVGAGMRICWMARHWRDQAGKKGVLPSVVNADSNSITTTSNGWTSPAKKTEFCLELELWIGRVRQN
mmetsp:Transcript_4314/g.15505  ORF Transcript_4314/g.15505 Transcript_4314/m.15505 type:complete len:87 (-) Transcript_4314:2214-2474(-)